MRRSLLAVLLLVGMCGCGKSEPASVVTTVAPIPPVANQQEMEAAITHARREVDSFIAELSRPTGSDHAVKVSIQDKGQTEYFWLTGVSFQNDEFTGTIDNSPHALQNVKIGQQWTVKKNEISDWTFKRDGQMRGNYTLQPLLKSKNSHNPAMPGMIGG